MLFLVRCGPRVVEPYGGMTAAGAEPRANYLLKWEAIRSARAAGATSYDMWGLVDAGIRQFKEGFGGREVRLHRRWDLPLSGVGWRTYRLAERSAPDAAGPDRRGHPGRDGRGTGRSHRGRGRMNGIARPRRPRR